MVDVLSLLLYSFSPGTPLLSLEFLAAGLLATCFTTFLLCHFCPSFFSVFFLFSAMLVASTLLPRQQGSAN